MSALGLATTATHVIWFIALAGAAGMALDTYFEAKPRLEDGLADATARDSERLATRLLEPRYCWTGDKLRVWAHNAGAVTIDALNLTILADGVVVTGFSRDLEGDSGATLWPVGYNATFNKTGVSSAPSNVLLVTGAGVRAYARQEICPLDAPVAHRPTCPGTVTSGTQTSCNNVLAENDTAYMQLDETSSGNPRLLSVQYTANATSLPATYTLQMRGAATVRAEDLHLQVRDPATSTWRTVATLLASNGSTQTTYGGAITSGEFNGGQYTIRLVDENTLTGSPDNHQSTWQIDWLKVVLT